MQVGGLLGIGQSDAGLLLAVIQPQAIDLLQHGKQRAVYQIVLLQMGGQLHRDVGRLDEYGGVVQHTQTGDAVQLLPQHTAKPAGKVLVALHGGEGQQPRLRRKTAAGGIVGKALQILKRPAKPGGNPGAAALYGHQPTCRRQPGNGTAQGAAVQTPHGAHVPLRRQTVSRPEIVGQDVGLNAFPGIFSGTRRVGLHGKSPPDGNLNWFEISINCLPSKRKEKWKEALAEKGVSLEGVWRNNDAYHALQKEKYPIPFSVRGISSCHLTLMTLVPRAVSFSLFIPPGRTGPCRPEPGSGPPPCTSPRCHA